MKLPRTVRPPLPLESRESPQLDHRSAGRSELNKLKKSPQTLGGSFSSVSTAAMARKDAFCSIFRDLQDLQSFAPLKSQNFSKKRVIILVILSQNFTFFNSNALFFFQILMKNYRNFTEMFNYQNSLKFSRKNQHA